MAHIVKTLTSFLKTFPGVPVLVAFLMLVGGSVYAVNKLPHGGLPSWTGSAEGMFVPPLPTEKLLDVFDQIAYDIEPVKNKEQDVPRVFIEAVPKDMDSIDSIAVKKSLFIRMMLPLILQVNQGIQKERERLVQIKEVLDTGEILSLQDKAWLEQIAARYKLKPDNIDGLLLRVDEVSVSLCLAQAIEESGWGTSRFAREGNALFGEWTWDGTGMLPSARLKGKSHRIRTFSELIEGVRSYAGNLNTHRAYTTLRKKRANLNRRGMSYAGTTLAGLLTAYSERGDAYVRSLRSIINTNDLELFDKVVLSQHPPRKVR